MKWLDKLLNWWARPEYVDRASPHIQAFERLTPTERAKRLDELERDQERERAFLVWPWVS